MKRNISIIYATSALTWGRFFVPVLALFYIASQVPIEQFAIIMSIFALVILVLEIPSGVLSDLLGKKRTLLLSRLSYIVEIVILAFFNSFWPFLIAKIISGVGVSLSSGTTSGILYDTLKKLGREKENKKVYGSVMSVQSIAMAIVFVIGAFLFSIDPKLPAILSLPFVTATFLLTFFLKEPYVSKKKVNLKNAFNHLKEGLIYTYNHNQVKFLVMYFLSIITITGIVHSLSSAYYEFVMIPIEFIGIFAFAAAMVAAIAAKKAHSFERYFGNKSFVAISIIMLLTLFLLTLSIPILGALCILLISFGGRLTRVLVEDGVNKRVETSHRVTILSIKNMGSNLAIFILFPITGFLIKDYTMQMGMMFLLGFFIVFTSLLTLYARKISLRKK